jgi:hypothetical protein
LTVSSLTGPPRGAVDRCIDCTQMFDQVREHRHLHDAQSRTDTSRGALSVR